MKRIFSTLCLALLSLTALADEGMWLPSLISSRIDDMRAKGFQLTAEDIYSINKASLKDAVMLFDDGCTAELISPEGLLITNHHCGYGAIQRLSSVEHDYLTDGFWAQSREEELPNENLNVKFLKRMEDITERLAAGESREEILEKARENGRYKASIEQMYYGNQQFLFVYEQFDDVRLVGTPPSSIGKFGGEPTTGHGPGTRATSRCSASMRIKTTGLRPTRPTTYPTARKNISRSPPKVFRKATSR